MEGRTRQKNMKIVKEFKNTVMGKFDIIIIIIIIIIIVSYI